MYETYCIIQHSNSNVLSVVACIHMGAYIEIDFESAFKTVK